MAIIETLEIFGKLSLQRGVLDVGKIVASPARLSEADGKIFPSGWQFEVEGSHRIHLISTDKGQTIDCRLEGSEIDNRQFRVPTRIPGVQRRFQRVTNAIFP